MEDPLLAGRAAERRLQRLIKQSEKESAEPRTSMAEAFACIQAGIQEMVAVGRHDQCRRYLDTLNGSLEGYAQLIYKRCSRGRATDGRCRPSVTVQQMNRARVRYRAADEMVTLSIARFAGPMSRDLIAIARTRGRPRAEEILREAGLSEIRFMLEKALAGACLPT